MGTSTIINNYTDVGTVLGEGVSDKKNKNETVRSSTNFNFANMGPENTTQLSIQSVPIAGISPQ